MKNVIIYGSGCKNCHATSDNIAAFARSQGIEIEIQNETDMMKIMQAGVMSTPCVAIDGEIVHSGSVPNAKQIAAFFADCPV